jgi:hypothetical protein
MKHINHIIFIFSLFIPCLSHAMMPDIHQAVSDCKFEQVQLLLAAGTNVNFVYAGFVPLHWAVIRNSEVMVQLLLRKGANVNATTQLGYSPLHFAAQRGSTGIARLLINNGANVTAINNEKQTPLDLAVQYNKRETAELLRKQIAMIGKTDNFRENSEEYRPAQQETQSNRSLSNNAWLQGGAVAIGIAGLAVLGYQLFKRR